MPDPSASQPLPTGTITFLFTDIEGSTPLWERDPQAMKTAVARHHAILQQAAAQYGGHVFKIVGDEFQIAFELPTQALNAALAAQRLLRDEPWGATGPIRVRMGLHTGNADLVGGVLNTTDYAVSHTLNRVGRIRTAGHGGQVLLSAAVMELLHGLLPTGVLLKDMGEYHLKGLLLPEHIFQVVAPDLPDSFPALKSEYAPQHNLPLQLSSFIGREKEIAEVKQLLGRTRLLTLSGVGGTGKTRLALAAAAQLLGDFEHGVWLVTLAPLGDPALIPSTVATLFGLNPEAGISLMETLNGYFRSKHLLLILDNCEHLIQEAARFANAVLQDAPQVKILATSRESLGLAGETVYMVPSMQTPDPLHLPPIQDLVQVEAVRLFIERACAVLPAFQVTEVNAPAVAQICQRLDGIPLAIELAAARVKALSTEQIASRLDDRFRLLTGGSRSAFPRHQTLHAMIDWSYGLLPEAERVLFRRLAVFSGGWTLEAAEALCPCIDQAEFEVLDGLAGLVNKSLVSGEMMGGEVQRYRMLETIRQYAQEKLLEAGEAAQMRDAHLEYFGTFAEVMEKKLHTPAYLEASGQLDAEVDNCRAALGWAMGAAQHEKLEQWLRLAAALFDYWDFKGLSLEVYGWLVAGLAVPAEEERLLPMRARAALKAGETVEFEDATALQIRSQSVALYRRTNDRVGLAKALVWYGVLLSDAKAGSPRPVDNASAAAFIEEGITLFEAMGDPRGLGYGYYGKSWLALIQKDYATQRKMLEKGAACFEQAGDILLSETLNWLLLVCTNILGDYEATRRLGEHCLGFYRKTNSKKMMAIIHNHLGRAAHLQEDYRRAESLYLEALRLYDEIGTIWHGVVWNWRVLGYCVARQGQIERAKQILLKGQSLGRNMRNGDQLGDPSGDLAFVLWMGSIAESLGQPMLAARFLGAVEGILETFFKPLDPIDQKEYTRLSSILHAGMDEAALTAAWAAGRQLNLEQALEEALAFCTADQPGTAA